MLAELTEHCNFLSSAVPVSSNSQFEPVWAIMKWIILHLEADCLSSAVHSPTQPPTSTAVRPSSRDRNRLFPLWRQHSALHPPSLLPRSSSSHTNSSQRDISWHVGRLIWLLSASHVASAVCCCTRRLVQQDEDGEEKRQRWSKPNEMTLDKTAKCVAHWWPGRSGVKQTADDLHDWRRLSCPPPVLRLSPAAACCSLHTAGSPFHATLVAASNQRPVRVLATGCCRCAYMQMMMAWRQAMTVPPVLSCMDFYSCVYSSSCSSVLHLAGADYVGLLQVIDVLNRLDCCWKEETVTWRMFIICVLNPVFS